MGFSKILKLIKNGDYSEAKTNLKQYLDNEEIMDDDIQMVANYYTSSKSSYVGYVLYRMQCVRKMYFQAYETFMSILKQCQNKKRDMWFSDVMYNASDDEVDMICKDLMERLEGDIEIPLSLLISEIVDEIIPILWNRQGDQKYAIIAKFAELIWFGELKTSTNLYEFAYSCAQVGSDLAEKLYLKVLEKEPANSEALNNIGMMYEKKADFAKAKIYYGRAHQFSTNQEIYRKNYERVSI